MVKILFLCTANSCRSQMAEGFARALKSKEVEAYSVGVETRGLNPNAVKVMAEAGLAHYRRVRDEIRAFVQELPDNLV